MWSHNRLLERPRALTRTLTRRVTHPSVCKFTPFLHASRPVHATPVHAEIPLHYILCRQHDGDGIGLTAEAPPLYASVVRHHDDGSGSVIFLALSAKRLDEIDDNQTTRGFSLTRASILELADEGLGTRTKSENSKRKTVIIGLEDLI
ncbi:hypothetical protein HAX54_006825 [Datura stramonium]|uniref:Uncharacterized protein n=1 Tax=Datura stramonium TaxID=4076 RepID=A0ABS8RUZ8_DATST|nr:hypothetical protein [Datura stramonium]